MSEVELSYEFNGELMPASKAIKCVIDEAVKMDDASAKAYLAFFSQVFNHTIIMAEKRETDRLLTKRLVAFCGLLGLLGMLFLVYFNPYASKWQSGFLWTGMCLFTAACCSVIPGFFKFKINGWLTAGGALGIFIFLYLNPPSVSKEDFTNPGVKINFFIARKDTSTIAAIPVDFNPTSAENICIFSNRAIAEFYGEDNKLDTLTFFRKSDGKIYMKERCTDLPGYDREIIGISSKILPLFNNKREAYNHFFAVASRN